MSCKKFLLVISILLLSFFVPDSSFSSEFYSDGDVVVVLKNSDSLQSSFFSASSEAEVTTIFSSLSEVSDNTFMLIHSVSKDPEELSKELLKDPDVIAASPNYKIYSSALYPDDTYLDACWGLVGANGINAPEAWEYSQGSSDVYVAVIDSGIDYENLDLAHAVDKNLSRNTINGSSYTTIDKYGHGTHIAGIIGAKGDNGAGIAGINWDVKLISVKALNDKGSGTVASVMSAVDYVISLINSGVNIRAVNMSFETYIKMTPNYNNLVAFPLWRVFKELDKLNQAVIVVAAGNYKEEIGEPSRYAHDIVPGAGCYVYPASFKGLNNMISVGALQSNGSLASFSNRGADMTAPGVNVLSTWLSGVRNVYYEDDGVSLKVMNGTSMAVPFISGSIALLASVSDDDVTAYQLKKALLRDISPSSAISASSEVSLKLDQALALYVPNRDNENIFPSTPPTSEYDNYNNSQSTQSESNTGSNGNESNNNNNNGNDDNDVSSGSSGCGTNLFAGFLLIILLPLLIDRICFHD